MLDAYGRWIPDYPSQRPMDDPQVVAAVRQTHAQTTQQPQQQTMTPYIDARMLEVGSVDDAEAFRMDAGTNQIFYTRDRTAFIIKEQGQNGYNLMIYDRRPPEPAKRYVTREELEQILAAIMPRQDNRNALNKEAG